MKFVHGIISLALAMSVQAQQGDKRGEADNKLMDREVIPADKIPPVRLLTPQEALADLQAPKGVKLSVAAAEPLCVMPVAGQFDARGRLWLVQMPTFMLDVDGKDESKPSVGIVCLEDTDADGVFDKKTDIVTDAKVARAVLPFNDGILWADEEKLYFLEIGPDLKPGKQIVVDSTYSKGGTVEHSSNGLLMHQDGWIYSVHTTRRYHRQPDGSFIRGDSEFRYQWGLTSDPWGRISNTGSGEFGSIEGFLPSLMNGSPYLGNRWAGVALSDNICKPRRVTPGINRAYQPGILDDQYKMKEATSVSGPTFCYGKAMGDWQGLFIPEPAAYLVKYIRIDADQNGHPLGTQPIKDTEFLTSTDELFRPVNCVEAPDGSLLILDMHMGILQHKQFVTTYLRKYILKHKLEQFTGFGRIFRVQDEKAQLDLTRPSLDTADAETLVKTLSHPSAWWRDMARRQIIERQVLQAVPALKSLLQGDAPETAKIQAVWSLKGLGQLNAADIRSAIKGVGTLARANMLSSAAEFNSDDIAAIVQAQAPVNALEAAIHARLLAGAGWPCWPQLNQLLNQWSGKRWVDEAAIAGLRTDADAFLKHSTADAFKAKLQKGIDKIRAEEEKRKKASSGPKLKGDELALFHAGKAQFAICAGCHGADGRGIATLGAPLAGSEWVTGDETRLLKVLLAGLRGPITVKGEKLSLPVEMPGSMQNPAMDDKALAAIATYIRNEWGNQAPAVKPEAVSKVRAALQKRGAIAYTEDELSPDKY
ncbi:MAG: hypothetical protein RL095_2405 [Verrucomicrobiota bacterium]|jgi:mono/diheme cytochrome c family protein